MSLIDPVITCNQPIEALQLALNFFMGKVGDPLTTQLPDNPTQRHSALQPYISTLLGSSTRYLQLTIKSQSLDALKYIAKLLIDASILVDSFDILYNDVFDIYQTAKRDKEFLEQLEPIVRSGQVGSIPPNVSQLLLRLYDPEHHQTRYQDLVIQLNPAELDINGVIKTTRHYKLWKAFIFVHLTALQDFTTPLLHLISIIRFSESADVEIGTLFAYLGHTLSDLVYPTQQSLDSIGGDVVSNKAKSDIYSLIFRARLHPDDDMSPSRTPDTTPSHSLSYPYMRVLLQLNARVTFAILNTGFEDGYFNEHAPISRQTIINTLLEMVYTHDLNADTIAHVEVFVASNISKYPQFILLPSSTVLRLLRGLSVEDGEESGVSHLERELAVQSLLSTFTLPSLSKIHSDLLGTFERARFYKILKSIYRARRVWAEYTRVVLSDGDITLFSDLDVAFRNGGDGLFDVFKRYVDDALKLNTEQVVALVEKHSIKPDETHKMLVRWCKDSANTVLYLKAVLEQRGDGTAMDLKHEYISLLAQRQSQEHESQDQYGVESNDICAVIDEYTFDASFLHNLFTQHKNIAAQMHLLYQEMRLVEAFECLKEKVFTESGVGTQTRALEKGAELAVKYTNTHYGDEDAERCTQIWHTIMVSAIETIQHHSLTDVLLEKVLNGLLMHTYNHNVKYSTLFSHLCNHFNTSNSVSGSHLQTPSQFRTILLMFLESIRARLEIYTVGARIMDAECAQKLKMYGEKSAQGWRVSEDYRRELEELRGYIEQSEELHDLAGQLEHQGVDWRSMFEIIHRPANAIKEMLENSLDAESTNIKVTVKDGGLKLLQIQDNGRGIDKEDLPILCERFTTSKIRNYDDLQSVSTFGFRGEALASISHVAHVAILTKRDGDSAGWKTAYSDGKQIQECSPAAGNKGTTITAHDLFFNVPLRRRALKNANEEYTKIVDVVTRYAVHYPSVSFIQVNANVPDISTLSKSSTPMNIKALFGPQVAKELLRFETEDTLLNYKCNGYATSTNYANCPSLKKSIENAYSALLPKGSHPFVYLSLEIPPSNLDVNVHPTKSQVHFIDEDDIIEHITDALSNKLSTCNTSKSYDVQTYLPKSKPVAQLSNASFLTSFVKPPPKSQIRTDGMTRTLDSFIPIAQTQSPAPTQSSTPVHTSTSKQTPSSTPVKRTAEDSESPRSSIKHSQSIRTPVEKIKSNKVNLSSIQKLRKSVLDDKNQDAINMVKNHTFVGFVDVSRQLVLIQHNTELIMLNYDKFALELFYQIALNQFGNMAKFELNPPPKVRTLIEIALKVEESAIVECGGSYKEVLDKIVNILISRATMLEEYFGIRISQEGNLERLPLLLKNYTPNIDALPTLLMNLGPLVNWEEEEECFDNILQQIAAFYVPSKQDNDAVRWQIQHVLFQSIAKNLVPSHDLAQNAITQVTSLPALYRIFERC
ncbi:hypothetical protein E3P91_00292 [Wallemia ichthyophaga]|nr:hypothetical protein E3P91_00292 [Wallemia ichthyophaga]